MRSRGSATRLNLLTARLLNARGRKAPEATPKTAQRVRLYAHSREGAALMGKQQSRDGWKDRKRFLQNYVVVNGYACPGLDDVPHPAVKLEVEPHRSA